MKNELQVEYNNGRFDIAIAMATAPIASAESAANYLYQTANAKPALTGGDVIALRMMRVRLLRAAATLDQALALAKPVLLQAAE